MKNKPTNTAQSILNNRPVYVAPANPAGFALAKQLREKKINVLGIFDNLKTGENIVNYKQECRENAVVVVCESAFQNDICLGLLEKGFTEHDVFCQQKQEFKPFQFTFKLRWQRAQRKLTQAMVSLLVRILPKLKHVYYAEQFIDTNVLLAWRYHQKNFPGEAILIGNNIIQLPKDLVGLKGIVCNRPARAFWHMVMAKSLVLDHEFHGLVFDIVRQQRPTTQMFHGLPLKHLAGNKHFSHINDQNFVSSSAWVNEHIFSRIFKAQNFHALGYPRNDALTQSANERDWITAPSLSALQDIEATTGPFIVYMPTYRDNGNNSYPIDYQRLERFCQQHNLSFILKFHPFVAKQLAVEFGMAQKITKPTPLPGFKHIYMFPPAMNVYPWLAEARALVTDYSSIIFDYLALNRPILLYQYDRENYLASRGQFLISMDNFNLGTMATSFDELEQKLLECIVEHVATDNWQQQARTRLGLVTQGASKAVVELVRQTK